MNNKFRLIFTLVVEIEEDLINWPEGYTEGDIVENYNSSNFCVDDILEQGKILVERVSSIPRDHHKDEIEEFPQVTLKDIGNLPND